jgi:heme exporter protein B
LVWENDLFFRLRCLPVAEPLALSENRFVARRFDFAQRPEALRSLSPVFDSRRRFDYAQRPEALSTLNSQLSTLRFSLSLTFAAMSTSFWALVRKDLLQEWRQKHTLYGVLLYLGSTIFAIYMMAGQPPANQWNILFWLCQLFVIVNSVARSFLGEPPARFRYYFTLVAPQKFLLAKMLYSVVMQALMTGLSLVLFGTLLGWPLVQPQLFCLVAMLGSFSLSVVFTFLSAIAARAGQHAALMAILGFPLITPILLILSRLAQKALAPVFQPDWWKLAAVLVSLDGLVLLLGLVLFPFLWQE